MFISPPLLFIIPLILGNKHLQCLMSTFPSQSVNVDKFLTSCLFLRDDL